MDRSSGKWEVLICDTIAECGIEKLRSSNFDVTYLPKISPGELLEKICEYDAVLVRSRTKITRKVIEAGRRLQVIGRAGVGLDNIDIEFAKTCGIQVMNSAEASSNAVAELIIGYMINLVRGICVGDAGLKRGEWLKGELVGGELSGRTLGIIGLGRIGRRLGRLAKAFSMNILGNDIIHVGNDILEEMEARMVPLEILLAESDFVSLHVPLTSETRYLINEEYLRKMKKNSYLINASRGGVVEENALLNILKTRNIAGAALDVFELEPPTSSELIKMPNVICTPHIGAQTVEAQDLSATLLAEKIIEVFSKMG
jgi:D-3-phosphoglycerate dehydrogenase